MTFPDTAFIVAHIWLVIAGIGFIANEEGLTIISLFYAIIYGILALVMWIKN